MWGFGIQREIPFGITLDVTYVARRGLYLQRERNINQLLPGTIQANPGVNIAALRPFKGYNVIRLTENSGKSSYNSLQVSADRRYRNGLKLGVAYTYGKSEDNASNKRTVLWNSYDDTNIWGPLGLRPPSRGQRLLHLRPAVLSRPDHVVRNLLGGWQVSGATFFRTGTPLWCGRHGHRGCRRHVRQSVNLVGDATPAPTSSSRTALTRTSGSTRRRSSAGRRHIRQRTPKRDLQPWRTAVGHRALQELQPGRHATCAVPGRVLQLPQPPELQQR